MQSGQESSPAQPSTSYAIPRILPSVFPLAWASFWLRRRIHAAVFNAAAPPATLIAENFLFTECPRMHNGHLYFSDINRGEVVVVDLDARNVVKRLSFDCERTGGIGWLPDGRLVVVSGSDHTLRVHDENTGLTQVYASFAHLSTFRANDMVVDRVGRAYIGNFGFNIAHLHAARRTTLVQVAPDPTDVTPAARDVFFPNGCVITPDGKTLIVAETLMGVLTAFDVAPDGSLSNRHQWADVALPVDGICLDAEGAVWAAVPIVGMYNTMIGGVLRVLPGGRIDRILGFGDGCFDRKPTACTLRTAPDGTHELVVTAAKSFYDHDILKYGESNGVVLTVPVHVGPALAPSDPRYYAGFW